MAVTKGVRPKKVPMRQCMGCGEKKEKKDLIRIIRTPDEEIVLDVTGKKNGRGAYLCDSISCLSKARKKKAIDRVSVATDASDNTKKKFRNMCEFYEVPMYEFGIKDVLGHSIGKEFRASLAVNDEGLAQAIMKKMD